MSEIGKRLGQRIRELRTQRAERWTQEKTGTPGADQRLVSFDDRARRSRSLREDFGGPGRCVGCSSVGALFGNRQETEHPARLAAATLGFLSKPAPELSGR